MGHEDMKDKRMEAFHKMLLWFVIIAFSIVWGASAALADDDDDDDYSRLTKLAISGASSVNESSSANYTATATFSNGTTRTVTTNARWSEDSSYATISGGVLKTSSVSSNRTVTITARYSSDGRSETAQKTVTILNASSTAVTLSGLTVSGASSVNEGSTSAYQATATFSNGSTQNVTTSALWSENSSYSSISSGGVLSASQVTGNQPVTVTASYASNGVTKTGTLSVTITDLTAPSPSATLQSISIGGPTSVSESTTTSFPVTATMSNNTTKAVTATMTEDSQYAAFNGSVLTVTAVSSNQTVNIGASYTEGGITRTATKAVTILDSSVTPPPSSGSPISGSHAGRFSAYEGTKTCLACHETQAKDIYQSDHYQWKGATTDLVNPAAAQEGKLGGINDFCIYPDINWLGKRAGTDGNQYDGGCAVCHIGMGAKPVATATPTQAQLENIDCLLCHSSQYKRTVVIDPATSAAKFVPNEAAMTVSLLQAASNIVSPGRDQCLQCHEKSGGGDNFKRGDLESAHRNPPTRDFDVHMSSTALGGANLKCTSCHTTTNHKVAGRGSDLKPKDSIVPVNCTTCHNSTPHVQTATLTSANATKLNTHAKRVNCTVCHIPTFAKVAPTDMERDWSVPGEHDAAKAQYDPFMVKRTNVTPVYAWWNGKSQFYNFGATAIPGASGRVEMSMPVGSLTTAGSKLYAFKHHLGTQPIDSVTNKLLPLKISHFFERNDIKTAIIEGQKAAGLPANAYRFENSERLLGLFHEVSPKNRAIGYQNCNACHNTTAPKVPLKSLGYKAKTGMTVDQVCSQCHSRETYSFNTAHTRSDHTRVDCSRCHDFSKAP